MKKVLLVDDHKLIYNGLKAVIKNFTLEYAPSNQEAMELIQNNDYYAVILDITLNDQKGFDIVSSMPDGCYIFFLTMHKSSIYIQMAKDLGARGYFLKDESTELIIKALDFPLSKPFWMSRTVEYVLNHAISYEHSNYEKLSPREQQIFALLAENVSNIEIARRLGISKKTVYNHRDHIMKKLEITSQIGLVREAVRLGIISV